MAIENKIYGSSASDPLQLKREYDGLKKKHNLLSTKIAVIFLVPVDDSGMANPLIDQEYTNLEVKKMILKLWSHGNLACHVQEEPLTLLYQG